MRKSFILHKDSLGILEKLDNDQAGKLFKAIAKYNDSGEIACDFQTELLLFPFQKQFDRDNDSYKKTTERNRINGSKGGRPKTQSIPDKPTGLGGLNNKPKKADSDSVNDSDSKSDNDSKSITKPLSSKPDQTLEIFQYWCDVMKKPSAKPTAKRIDLVKKRLKEGYSVNQIKEAIYGCSITPHNNGTDPKGNGQKYDDLELICRRGEFVERFIENGKRFKSNDSQFSPLTQQNIETLQNVELD